MLSALLSSRSLTCLAASLAILCSLTQTLHAQSSSPAAIFPGADWERAKPESVGYSSARLEALRTWLKTQQTTAMMVSVGGKVIFEYGDLSRASKVASVRKSVLSMLYGNYVVSGKIDTGKTVKQIGLDDNQP